MRLKRDHQIILDRIRDLKKESWLGTSRLWWPDYIYHTTSLANVVEILKQGRLLSRERALEENIIVNDIADPGVLDSTSEKWKKYVRFYLRPKTPTLYINEGVKPRTHRGVAHCGVPICLMFNSRKMLTRRDAIFSDGNLASGSTSTDSSSEFFRELPFKRIFHVGGISAGFNQQIKVNRCAEAIFPNEVNLSALEKIICRSEAEKETLLHLMLYKISWDSYMTWKNHIGVSSPPVFNEEWNFIRNVNYTGEQIIINFNPPKHARGPFRLAWGMEHLTSEVKSSFESDGETFHVHDTNIYRINLSKSKDKSFHFWLKLDDLLIYKNTFYSDDDPIF